MPKFLSSADSSAATAGRPTTADIDKVASWWQAATRLKSHKRRLHFIALCVTEGAGASVAQRQLSEYCDTLLVLVGLLLAGVASLVGAGANQPARTVAGFSVFLNMYVFSCSLHVLSFVFIMRWFISMKGYIINFEHNVRNARNTTALFRLCAGLEEINRELCVLLARLQAQHSQLNTSHTHHTRTSTKRRIQLRHQPGVFHLALQFRPRRCFFRPRPCRALGKFRFGFRSILGGHRCSRGIFFPVLRIDCRGYVTTDTVPALAGAF